MSLFTTTSEEKIRNHWLLSTFCFLVLYPLLLCVLMAVLSVYVPVTQKGIYEPLGYAASGTLSLLIIWHCAYRKFGNRLLRLWLVVVPARTFVSTMEYFKVPYSAWTIVFIVIETSLFLWWFVLTLKMLRINKAVRKRLPISL